MVLTNFECWAHGGDAAAGAAAANFETGPPTRAAAVDVFNPRAVSHMASNGYYGYAYVNDANNNNNDNNSINIDVNSSNNNGNNNGSNSLSVDTNMQQCNAGAVRCKKRCMDTFFSDAAAASVAEAATAAKRCRFDNGDLAAQYFNDFFSLPATQIGTQACLMDYDMPAGVAEQQQQQQQQQPRINQHYQDRRQQQKLPNANAVKPIETGGSYVNREVKAAVQTEVADLYVATHGGCLHHLEAWLLGRCEDAEFDI